MKARKDPDIFPVQLASDEAPFDTWDGITRWTAIAAMSASGPVRQRVPHRSSPRHLQRCS